MSQLLVTMTHEDLPGVEREASLNAYRYVWFEEGWRSADDPSWTGDGSEAPTPHVGDNALHGGGIEIDYAEIVADTAGLPVNALAYAAVPGLVINVPSGLLHPTYLMGHVRMTSSTASSTVAATWGPVGSSSLLDGRGIAYQTTRATADPVTTTPFYRLPAGTGGDWQIYVAGTATLTITVKGSTQGVSSARAVAA